MNRADSQNFPKVPNGEMHLSDKQLMAIELLIAGHNLCEIAPAVGVTRRSLSSSCGNRPVVVVCSFPSIRGE
jgi:hypothetical protein